MIARLAGLLTRWAIRWVPDSFVIAILLTVVVFALTLAVTASTPLQVVQYWGDGLWELLSFGMQMCLVVLTGFVVAVSPPVKRALVAVARIGRTPRQSIAVVAVTSMALAWLNWGLSIVASAMLARNVARRGHGVDYRLLVTTAYLGMGCVWHAGLSGSVFLLVATPGHFMAKEIGVIPVTRTLFSPFNLGLTVVVIAVMTALAVWLHPAPEDAYVARPDEVPDDSDGVEPVAGGGANAGDTVNTGDGLTMVRPSFVQRVERSRLVMLVPVVLGALWIYLNLRSKGPAGFNLNVLNLLFLVLGGLLHGTPASFLRAAEEGGRYLWGIVIQFPLYAGIFGMIKFSELQTVISGWLASFLSAGTYHTFVLWYSGVLNYIIPSGGSKWAIEAPYVLEAAHRLGASIDPVITAYAWGDMMTDIIQPFWAIPLLAITRLQFRDIMGYALVFFLVYAAVVTGAFVLFG
ncbi:MAG TPA: TIGR00366 family protein [Candidatus Eisenbacteria bacterium]